MIYLSLHSIAYDFIQNSDINVESDGVLKVDVILYFVTDNYDKPHLSITH